RTGRPPDRDDRAGRLLTVGRGAEPVGDVRRRIVRSRPVPCRPVPCRTVPCRTVGGCPGPCRTVGGGPVGHRSALRATAHDTAVRRRGARRPTPCRPHVLPRTGCRRTRLTRTGCCLTVPPRNTHRQTARRPVLTRRYRAAPTTAVRPVGHVLERPRVVRPSRVPRAERRLVQTVPLGARRAATERVHLALRGPGVPSAWAVPRRAARVRPEGGPSPGRGVSRRALGDRSTRGQLEPGGTRTGRSRAGIAVRLPRTNPIRSEERRVGTEGRS